MPQSTHRQTSVIIGKSLITAETVASELRERLVRLIDSGYWFRNQDELLILARDILREFEPLLAENLQSADLAAWIAGYNQVVRQLPDWAVDLFRTPGRPPGGPPRITLPGLFGGDEPEPELRFPLLENALQSLIDRQILTRQQFNQLSSDARARAFTIAGDMTEDALSTIRDTLAEDIQEGTSLTGFRDRLDERLQSSFLGPAHLENVYRTNTQAAFRDGRESLANHPIVDELFPYQSYDATRDSRVRPEHLALETLGIDGTNVYRRADPFWDYFTVPWDYNCRCTNTLQSVESAARKGVKEAQRWLETGVKPPLISRLPDIPFRPPAGFGFRGRKTVGVA